MSLLPPKISSTKQPPDRVYRTALRSDLFIKLEQEAQERGGLTAYKLTQIIMTLYLEDKLLLVEEPHIIPESEDEA